MGLIERKNRYIALLLTVLLVFITAGCGKGGSGTESRESKDDSGQEMTVTPTAVPDTPTPTAMPDTPTPTAMPDTPTPTAVPDTPTPTAVPDTPTPAESTPTVLKMWHDRTSPFEIEIYKKVAAELAEKYPNITLEIEVIDMSGYRNLLAGIKRADELPDIFLVLGDMSFQNLMKQGLVSCFDDVYPQYEEKLAEKMCEAYSLEGKKYAAPSVMNAVVMYANMDVLAQVGYTAIPKTWDEMKNCCELLIDAGKIPFAISGRETWCLEEYLESIALRTCGEEELRKIFYGEATWNNEGIVEAVDLLQEMKQKGYFGWNYGEIYNDQVKEAFMEGNRYAFYVNGSWDVSWFEKSDSKITAEPFPVFDTSKSEYNRLIGGPGDAFAVSSATKNPEIAKQYAMDFAQLISRYLYLAEEAYPVWAVDYDCSELSVMRQQMAEMLLNTDSFLFYCDTVIPTEELMVYAVETGRILEDTMTGKQYAEKLAEGIR